MAEELGDELRALFAQADGSQGAAPDEVVAAVLAGAGRRRRSRTLLSVAAASVGVLAIGGASWAVTTTSRSTTPVDQPSVTVTVTASAAPDASADVSAAEDPYAGDLDGILDDEYPEAAPAREDTNDYGEFGAPVEYPDALVMEDWVWDRVGEGWSVATVGIDDGRYSEDDPIVPAVIYLVSPEDVYFEIAELPEELWDGVRVVSWNEDDDSVRLSYGLGGYYGARFDLRTGDWETVVFAAYGATAFANEFVAADADGNELWSARSENGTKYYRWDAEKEHWSASALVDQAPFATAVQDGIGLTSFAASPNGDTVLLYGRDEDRDYDGTIVLYSLGEDTVTVVDAPALQEAYVLWGVWIDDSTASINDATGGSWEFDVDAGELVEVDEPTFSDWPLSSAWLVGFGDATDDDVTSRECGC
ncbi:hypothetical protein [Demequina sp. NBRC 110054]|uniref:hypothetical protein n=1 Tax=Demequina sp. NBRC 110054 TaxID=1570343 RepID=UPI0009FE2D5D|nr:hypothetical protein [Demequina sp. NBRC 110054]